MQSATNRVPTNADLRLEPDAATMRAWIDAVTEHAVRYIASLPHQPAGYGQNAADGARALVEEMPEQGNDLAPLLELLFDRAIPESFNTAGPGYLAYIPGGGVFSSALAELIAAATNRYVGVWLAAPLLVQLETNVLRWFCSMMGLPAGSRGILTTGGSMANFTAIVTARRERLPEDFLSGVIYTSDQTHHSVAKAAVLAGFPTRNIVTVPSDERFCMRVDELESRIADDRRAGRQPFLVVASAGTTNTGAVDDLPTIANLCRRERLWLHVDAAYGGFFQLTDAGRRELRGIERADSITLDPHKGLFLPYGIGALVVRDGLALKRAHSIEADYMPPMQSDDDEHLRMDFCEHSLELSRDFRGLRVWLPIKLHGIAAFRANLDEKLRLARNACDRLREMPGIEIVAEPQLSAFAFRLARPGLSLDQLNDLNRRLLDRILTRQRVWLNATQLNGRFVIRICVLSFRTHQDRMDECIEIIRAALNEV